MLKRDKLYLYLLLPFLLFHLSSCGVSSPTPRREDLSPETKGKEIESSMKIRAMNDKILMSTLSSRKATYRDYKIGPEDLLEIAVFEDEKLNKVVRVSSQGNISLPLLGVILVKGLTSSQLEKELRDLLAEKYFQDPHVTVFIKEFRSQRISVLGAIVKPGMFEVSGDKTILDMLGMSGGLKEDAGQILFLIRPPQGAGMEVGPAKERRENEDLTPQTYMIDLEALLARGDWTLNLSLFNGDVIHVPVAGRIFVGGEVKNPGGFNLGKKLTVGQAVTLSGGVTQKADGGGTKIFRFSNREGEKEVLSADIYEIAKGKAPDIYLKENDIVVVPKSGVKSFYVEFRDTIKGLIGFGFSLGSI